jgi:ligand-binding sensor domain-containing protein
MDRLNIFFKIVQSFFDQKINYKGVFLILFIIALIIFPAHAHITSPSYQFQAVKVDNYRTQEPIYDITKDSFGFIWWVSTQGLFRYDGNEIINFRNDPNDQNSLSFNLVRCLAEDDRKRLWLGTQGGGLSRLDLNTGKFHNFPEYPEIEKLDILNIVHDRNGNTWLATGQKGLFKIDTLNKLHHIIPFFQTKPNQKISRIRTLLYEKQKNILWMGTEGAGLYTYDINNEIAEPYTLINDRLTNGKTIYTIFRDHQSQIWIGGQGYFACFNSHTNEIVLDNKKLQKKTAICGNFFLSITEDPQSNIWVGTDTGINIVDPNKEECFVIQKNREESNGLKNDLIRKLYLSDQGIIWIGTNNGLFKNTGPSDFQSIEMSNSIIRGVFKNAAGQIFASDALSGRFFRVIDHHYHTITSVSRKINEERSNYVTAFMEDQNGDYWLGTWYSGIYIFDHEWQFKKHLDLKQILGDSPNSNQVQSILNENGKNIWIGTENGLASYNTELSKWSVFQQNSTPYSLIDNRIQSNALIVDHKGNAWVGTWNGLTYLDFQKEKSFHWEAGEPNNELPINHIISLHLGQENLWIGTYGGGLNRLDLNNRQIKHVFGKDEFAHQIIFAIQEDHQGNLWLSKSSGISQYQPKTDLTIHFMRNSELELHQFYYGSSVMVNDEIYFGGYDGVIHFNPMEVKFNQNTPSVWITDYKINFDSEKNPFAFKKDTIRLSSNDPFLSFRFASLDYAAPETTQYRYRLIGFEDSYNKISGGNEVRYTNIPYGR